MIILQENKTTKQPSEWVGHILDGIYINIIAAALTAKSVIRLYDNLKRNCTLVSSKLSEFISKKHHQSQIAGAIYNHALGKYKCLYTLDSIEIGDEYKDVNVDVERVVNIDIEIEIELDVVEVEVGQIITLQYR